MRGYLTELTDVAGVAIDAYFGCDACELFLRRNPVTIVVGIDSEGFNIISYVLHLHHGYVHVYIVTKVMIKHLCI